MKKSDLQSGMIVQLRNGSKMMIIKRKNSILAFNENEWLDLNDYSHSLLYEDDNTLDIIKIYEAFDEYRIIPKFWNEAKLIWKERELKEIKIDEDLINLLKDLKKKHEGIYSRFDYKIEYYNDIKLEIIYSHPFTENIEIIDYEKYGYIDKRREG